MSAWQRLLSQLHPSCHTLQCIATCRFRRFPSDSDEEPSLLLYFLERLFCIIPSVRQSRFYQAIFFISAYFLSQNRLPLAKSNRLSNSSQFVANLPPSLREAETMEEEVIERCCCCCCCCCLFFSFLLLVMFFLLLVSNRLQSCLQTILFQI